MGRHGSAASDVLDFLLDRHAVEAGHRPWPGSFIRPSAMIERAELPVQMNSTL